MLSPHAPGTTRFRYTTLFRSRGNETEVFSRGMRMGLPLVTLAALATVFVGHFNGILMSHQQPMKMAAADAVFETKKDRKSTRLNSSHPSISYAVFSMKNNRLA